jgi:hypothetical protein
VAATQRTHNEAGKTRILSARRQVQCAAPLKVAASQKGLSEARLHRFLRFLAK